MAVENTHAHHDLDYLWLPAEFLTDDDILTDFKFSNGFGDLISSPVDSHGEDDDDFFGEISRISCSDDQDWKLPASPQSTLMCMDTANTVISSEDHSPAFYATSLFPPLPPKPSYVTILKQNSRQAFQYQIQAPPTCFQQQQKLQETRNGGALRRQGIEYQLGRRSNGNGHGSGIRAITGTGTGTTKERKGTGVFMPRRYGSTCQRSAH